MDYKHLREILQDVSVIDEKEYPPELDNVLIDTARSGIVRFSWDLLKPYVRFRLQRVLTSGFEGQDCENDEGMCEHLLDQLDKFDNPPFTIQRLCELITNPKQHYKKIGAYMRAVERNLLVVSTQEPDLTWMKSPRLTQLLEGQVSDKENILGNTDPSPQESELKDSNSTRHQVSLETIEYSKDLVVSRKRKSCDRDETSIDEGMRTVLQEADSTTTVAIDNASMISSENVAKRLKPSSSNETLSNDGPPEVKGQIDTPMSSIEHIPDASTGQSESCLTVDSNGK